MFPWEVFRGGSKCIFMDMRLWGMGVRKRQGEGERKRDIEKGIEIVSDRGRNREKERKDT